MKNSIYNRKYQEFSIGSLFYITRGNAKNIRDKGCGDVVLVSAIDNNNGFYQMVQHENEKIYSNVLTVNNNGNGVCLSYFHEYKFMASSDVSILLPKNNYLKKREVGIFISCLIKKQKSKFNYGYKMNNIRMEKQKILLPVDDLGNPDYKFMEDFIKEREKSKREKYRKYVENKLKTLGKNGDFRERELLNKKWGEFKVKDIFSIIEKCKCNNASKFFDGNIPYVGATNKNNGVMRLIEADKKFITKGNCVCFVCDGQGSVGYSIYKKEDFVGSTTLKVGRFEFINEFIAQFLISALDKNRFIYSFGYKRTEERLKNEKILLPITENEEIDYEFMENYMKYLILRKYQKYLEYQRLNN